MDKLSEHAIRMLEIEGKGKNDGYIETRNMGDIARAVYDTILRVQALERKADRKDEPNSSEIPNNCEYEDIFEYCPRCGMRILVSKPKDESQNHSGEATEMVKDEPTISKMEQVDKDINVRSKDEPHIVGKHADAIIIDESRLTAKCLNCANGGSYKCSKCDGEMYFKDEPQTCEDCRHNGVKHAYDYACDKCTDMDKFQHEDEPQVIMPKECKGCDSASKIIEAYSRGFEDGADAVKAMPQTGRSE